MQCLWTWNWRSVQFSVDWSFYLLIYFLDITRRSYQENYIVRSKIMRTLSLNLCIFDLCVNLYQVWYQINYVNIVTLVLGVNLNVYLPNCLPHYIILTALTSCSLYCEASKEDIKISFIENIQLTPWTLQISIFLDLIESIKLLLSWCTVMLLTNTFWTLSVIIPCLVSRFLSRKLYCKQLISQGKPSPLTNKSDGETSDATGLYTLSSFEPELKLEPSVSLLYKYLYEYLNICISGGAPCGTVGLPTNS